MSGPRESHRRPAPAALLASAALMTPLAVGTLAAGALAVGPLVLLVPLALGALGMALVLLFGRDAPIG